MFNIPKKQVYVRTNVIFKRCFDANKILVECNLDIDFEITNPIIVFDNIYRSK